MTGREPDWLRLAGRVALVLLGVVYAVALVAGGIYLWFTVSGGR